MNRRGFLKLLGVGPVALIPGQAVPKSDEDDDRYVKVTNQAGLTGVLLGVKIRNVSMWHVAIAIYDRDQLAMEVYGSPNEVTKLIYSPQKTFTFRRGLRFKPPHEIKYPPLAFDDVTLRVLLVPEGSVTT
jgi:hypothetical protein